MIKGLKIVSFVALAVVLSACNNQYLKVYSVRKDAMPVKGRGVFYALPKNGIKVDVEVEKTMYLKGPFAEYAEQYLNIDDVLERNYSTYEIKDVTLSAFTTVDDSNYFYVQLPSDKQSMSLNFDKKGLLQGMNVAQEEEEHKAGVANMPFFSQSQLDDFAKTFLTSNLKVDIDTIVEKVLVDSMMVERRRYNKSLVQRSDQEKAKEAAEMIFKLQAYKLSLVSGDMETAYAPQTLQLMVDELDKKIQEYLELFSGVSLSLPQKYTYYYIPEEQKKDKEIVLFRFNKNIGVLPLYEDGGMDVTLRIQSLNQQFIITKFENSASEDMEYSGLYYRMPQECRVEVVMDEDVYAENEFVIAQFGRLLQMPKTHIHDKILLDKNGGNLLEIEFAK